VEVGVAGEVLAGSQPLGLAGDRGAEPVGIGVAPAPGGQPGRGHLEELARLQQLVERDLA
jgi:hypothetical protein